MTPQKRKQQIEDVIMATDAVLHTDWLTRLDTFIENGKEESLSKQRYLSLGFILFFAMLFIGFGVQLHSSYEIKIDRIKKEYELKYQIFIDNENFKIDSVNKWNEDNRPIQVTINKK